MAERDTDEAPRGQPRDNLAEATGSNSTSAAKYLFTQALGTNPHLDYEDPGQCRGSMQGQVELLCEIKPRDPLEGMLVAQMVAAHGAAMDCIRSATISGQNSPIRDKNFKHAVKFMAMYERQLAALDKRRGGAKQKITVEHVQVNAGGQAIVGDVNFEALSPSSATATLQVQPVPLWHDECPDGGDTVDHLTPPPPRPVKARVRTRP